MRKEHLKNSLQKIGRTPVYLTKKNQGGNFVMKILLSKTDKTCWKIYDLKEDVLKHVVFQIHPALEPRYLDFLDKYLNACLRIFPVSENVVKFCFSDTRRNIYYWLPLKANGQTDHVKIKEWEQIKKVLAKRIAGVVRHTFLKNQQDKN